MTDNFKVQWSVSLPPAAQYAKGDMLNIRGETVEEVQEIFDAVLSNDSAFIASASEVAALLRSALVIADAPANGNSQSPAKDDSPPAASTQHRCEHGVMEYKAAFESRAGKKISASWNCPLGYKNPKACKTEWVDD